MNWDKQYEIDVAFIDEQHREWFARVARLGRAIEGGESNAEMAKALKFVVEYTQKHFADEEAYMQEMHCPRLEPQKKLHKAFVQYIVDVLVNLKNGKEVPALRLYQFMSDWFKQHIQEEDQQIRLNLAPVVVNDAADADAVEALHDPLAAKLGELGELLASDLINEVDFNLKKLNMLQQFIACPPAKAPADAMAVLEKLKSFMNEGLLSEDDLKIGREQLAQSVDLSKELALQESHKAKMIHLKNLLGEEIISAEQFETHKAEILDQM